MAVPPTSGSTKAAAIINLRISLLSLTLLPRTLCLEGPGLEGLNRLEGLSSTRGLSRSGPVFRMNVIHCHESRKLPRPSSNAMALAFPGHGREPCGCSQLAVAFSDRAPAQFPSGKIYGRQVRGLRQEMISPVHNDSDTNLRLVGA